MIGPIPSRKELAGDPDVHVSVQVADGEGPAVRAERQAEDLRSGWVGEGADELMGGGVPQVGVAVSVGGGHERAVWVKRDPEHAIVLVGVLPGGSERAEETTGGDAPQVGASVVVGGGHGLAIRAERDVTEATAARVVNGAILLAGGYVPQIQRVATGGGQELAVLTECHPYTAAPAIETLDQPAGGDVPHVRVTRVFANGQELTVRAERHPAQVLVAFRAEEGGRELAGGQLPQVDVAVTVGIG